MDLEFIQVIQDDLKIHNLVSSAKIFFSNKVTQALGIGTWTYLLGILPTFQSNMERLGSDPEHLTSNVGARQNECGWQCEG